MGGLEGGGTPPAGGSHRVSRAGSPRTSFTPDAASPSTCASAAFGTPDGSGAAATDPARCPRRLSPPDAAAAGISPHTSISPSSQPACRTMISGAARSFTKSVLRARLGERFWATVVACCRVGGYRICCVARFGERRKPLCHCTMHRRIARVSLISALSLHVSCQGLRALEAPGTNLGIDPVAVHLNGPLRSVHSG